MSTMIADFEFQCPKCGALNFEEVQVDLTCATSISQVREMDDGDVQIEYGEQTNESGHVDRYQCMGCGYTIVDDKSPHADDGLDEHALAKALKELIANAKPKKGDLVSHSELCHRLANALEISGGEELARIWNEVCPDEVIYEGDSLFWVKK